MRELQIGEVGGRWNGSAHKSKPHVPICDVALVLSFSFVFFAAMQCLFVKFNDVVLFIVLY